MSKKMMLLALAVVSATMFALPSIASAQTWHINQTVSFSITGEGGKLTSTDGTVISCSTTTGSGTFTTLTSGSASLIFHNCTGPFGFACTTPGQSSGTITASNSFDGIMLATNKPGVALTPSGVNGPSGGKQFTEFSCLGISIKVYGSGIIGTIHSPANPCGLTGTTWGLQFESSSPGHPKHTTWTGSTTHMYSNASASFPTSSLDGTATLHLASSRTLTCTHVA